MTNEESFQRWRAAAGPWATWLKPSLLALCPDDEGQPPPDASADGWPADAATAVIVDLPGRASVALGVALSARGSCPVPLFNTTPGWLEYVPTRELMAALKGAALQVGAHTAGPPAFLLDSHRHGDARVNGADYDNRWYVFDSDLPSEEALVSKGIARILVVCEGDVASDLADALAGFRRLELRFMHPGDAESFPLPKPRSGVRRGLARIEHLLQRNAAGGFGRRISHG